jgi:hypothetical protein
LEQALERLIAELPELKVNDFYGIIFSFIEEKLNLCREFPEEMPDQFFKQSEEIKAEIRECMDFTLYGVVKEESE